MHGGDAEIMLRLGSVQIQWRVPIGSLHMNTLALCVIMQMCLSFGLAGLIWPERLMPLFGVLMFPWPASHRAIRANGIAVIGAYLLLMGKLLIGGF